MRQIRYGVFESNSSSTHSIAICTQEEFDNWMKHKLVFDSYNDVFVKSNTEMTNEDKVRAKRYYEDCKKEFWKSWEQLSDEEVEAWYKKYMEDEMYVDTYRYKTYNEFFYDSDLETFTQHYTSPSGDKLVAFGRYGYDG